MTYEAMRADIADMLGEEPEAIGPHDNLMDRGLDSMRLMSLIGQWQEAGVDLEFGEFAEQFTLAAWWDATRKRQAARSPD